MASAVTDIIRIMVLNEEEDSGVISKDILPRFMELEDNDKGEYDV